MLVAAQAKGRFGMDLGDEPLDDHARVNDETTHRRRSSAINSVLSENERPARLSRIRAAAAHASLGSSRAASSRMTFSSACRDRLFRLARAFNLSIVEASRSRIKTWDTSRSSYSVAS